MTHKKLWQCSLTASLRNFSEQRCSIEFKGEEYEKEKRNI